MEEHINNLIDKVNKFYHKSLLNIILHCNTKYLAHKPKIIFKNGEYNFSIDYKEFNSFDEIKENLNDYTILKLGGNDE